MFKTAVSLEETGKVQIVALDKTGTITSGEPNVTDIVTAEGIRQGELLQTAYALEQKSEHPLAKAVMTYAEEQKLTESVEMTGFQVVPGNGLSGWCDGERLWGGNLSFIRKTCAVSEDMQAKAKGLADQGKTPLFLQKKISFLESLQLQM